MKIETVLRKKLYVLFGLFLSVCIASVSTYLRQSSQGTKPTPTATPEPQVTISTTPTPAHGGVLTRVVSVVDGDSVPRTTV